MAYLMIENPGEAPLPGLLLFGATTKDPGAGSKTIGMFGSGTKYGVLVCLRKNVDVRVYTGTTNLQYSLVPQKVGEVEHKEVMVSVGNAKPVPTGATLAFGQHDWGDDIRLALREFISNALDSVDGDADRIRLEIVDSPRAEAGTTRVYVRWSEGIQGRETLEKFKTTMFLHFRPGYDVDYEGPIRKVEPGTTAKFYRRGVLIRSSQKAAESLWDYNFVGLQLDEARNSDEYTMRYRAGDLLKKDPRKFARTAKAVSQDDKLWEADLDAYSLTDYGRDAAKGCMDALLQEFGDVVFVQNEVEAQILRNEGLLPVGLPDGWANAVKSMNGPTFLNSLKEDQREQRKILDPKQETLRVVEKWSRKIGAAGLAKEEHPPVFEFREPPDKLEKLWGFCRFGEGIYINTEAAGDLLELTVIEELAHWHSGKADYDRGFQNWIIRLLLREDYDAKD